MTHSRKLLKIKFEVDTDPPSGFDTVTKPLIKPIPFWVRAYSLPDLFAGKMSALLCRRWGERVKGRDWYDLLWFMQRKTPIHLAHLENRLRQFDFYFDKKPLSLADMKQFFLDAVKHLDVERAKEDIRKFIKNDRDLEGWSRELFMSLADQFVLV